MIFTKNKKGVSDVVTTVLIILFGIVAVAIVGSIVINQVNKAGKSIDKQSICIDNQFTIDKCTLTNNAGVAGTLERATFIVSHKSGDLQYNNAGIQINLKANDGSVKSLANVLAGDVSDIVDSIAKGNIASGVVDWNSPETQPKTVSISVPVYIAGSTGETQVCQTPEVICVA